MVSVALQDIATTGRAGPAVLELPFVLGEQQEAHEPPEARGVARDAVRLLVSGGAAPPIHAVFTDLPDLLRAGDLLVVNTSGTLPAALDGRLGTATGEAVVVHRSTVVPGGLVQVELRTPRPGGHTEPFPADPALPSVPLVVLADGTTLHLLNRVPGSNRLWLALSEGDPDLRGAMARIGRPIRYRYVHRDWPLDAYQSVFALRAGSAEMASAARPFSEAVVIALVRRGVGIAPLTLDTGVSSLEGHEQPYPEQYEVPAPAAAAVNAVRRHGGRVIAVGTTVVRALESTVDSSGIVHPGRGWTDVVVTAQRGARSVDGLLTGWHEPGASHLAMLEAVTGADELRAAYVAAYGAGYRWHEFGDSHLLLR